MSYLSFDETKSMYQLDDTFTIDMYEAIMNLNTRVEFINGKFGHTVKTDPNNPEVILVLDKNKLKVIQVQPQFIILESYAYILYNEGFCPGATPSSSYVKTYYDCLVHGGFLVKNTITERITCFENLKSLHVYLNNTKDLKSDLEMQTQAIIIPRHDRVFVSKNMPLHYTDVDEYNRVLNEMKQCVLSSALPDYTKGKMLFKLKL